MTNNKSKVKGKSSKHSKKKPAVIPKTKDSNTQIVLELIDREIAFYRKRAGQIYFFCFLVEGLFLAGEQKLILPEGWNWISITVYTFLFFAIGFIGWYLGEEYRRRIHILKDSRIELLEQLGYKNIFPDPAEKSRSEIKVLYLLLIVLSIAGAGLIILSFYLSK